MDTVGIPKTLGPYRLIRPLGRGGMGSVHLAERQDGEVTMRVAIKLVRRELVSPDILNRFRKERQVLADLHHPNIARLLDAGTTEDGLPYLIMEYIDGENIVHWNHRCQPDLLTLLRKLLRLVAAVGHAHQKGLIHRDIKPGNIMVTPEGEPMLLDFGIAITMEQGQTTPGFQACTWEYASPEQRRGNKVFASSDIYSLGLVFLQLLARVSVTHLANPLELIDALITGSLPDVDPQAPTVRRLDGTPATTRTVRRIPESLGYVLRHMLDESDRRYSNTQQLAAVLEDVLAGLPPGGDPIAQDKSDEILIWYHPADRDAAGDLAVRIGKWNLPVWIDLDQVAGDASRLGATATNCQSSSFLYCLYRSQPAPSLASQPCDFRYHHTSCHGG